MAVNVDYPCNIAGVLIASLSTSELEHVRRNDVQTGPARFELLTSLAPMLFNVSWNFSLLEYQVFEGWFKYNTSFGSKPFNISLPVGMGDVLHECYFYAAYTVNRSGKRVLVQATLYAVEKQYNTACDSLDLELISRISSDKDKCTFYNDFISFAEVTLPDKWADINYGTDFS